MGNKQLESGAVSVFCESAAIMLSAGIQTEEALGLLSENTNDPAFQSACDAAYRSVVAGNTLADALASTQAFPDYAIDMIRSGEKSGRLEQTLSSLGRYYDEEDRLITKLHSSVTYPVALFALMTIILVFTLSVIIPIFIDTYQQVAGGLGTGVYGFVNAALVIGWIALFLAVAGMTFTIFIAVITRSGGGLAAAERVLSKLPFTKDAADQMALSRFTSVLSSYSAVGVPADEAVCAATETVDNAHLRAKLDKAVSAMQDENDPLSLSQAFLANNVYGPVYTRMMSVGDMSGDLEDVLDSMSATFFDDASMQMDESMDRIEPALAAFLTITIGATLIAVMIPLIGILGSIG